MIIIYWILSFLFSLLFFQLFGTVWGIGFFLYCLFKQDSIMAEAQTQPKHRRRTKRTGVGFIDALAFFGFLSLMDDDD